MNEYLAFIAATTGRLGEALAHAAPERDVLTAASDILEALLIGGPAEDIDDYGEAPVAIARWLHHMDNRVENIGDLLTIQSVRHFCDQDDWAERLDRGTWTAADQDEIRSRATALLADSRWPDLALKELGSSDPLTFWRAERGCRLLGIDTFEQLLSRIDADPIEGPWYQAWEGADRSRAETLTERVPRLLDLDAIASGPTSQVGLGPEFQLHNALGWTLQGVREHVGVGSEIVAAALRSSSIQNRNAAMNALEAWGPVHWTNAHRQRLNDLAETDPDPKVKLRAASLLQDRGVQNDGQA